MERQHYFGKRKRCDNCGGKHKELWRFKWYWLCNECYELI